jgi:hypothetical protein
MLIPFTYISDSKIAGINRDYGAIRPGKSKNGKPIPRMINISKCLQELGVLRQSQSQHAENSAMSNGGEPLNSLTHCPSGKWYFLGTSEIMLFIGALIFDAISLIL